MALDPFGLPPEEALRWFREKGYALTFDWRDMQRGSHARAFTVAKATQLDILADIRDELDKAIRGGGTLAEFRKALKPTLQKKGWWGEKEVPELDVDLNPTGETKLVQLGSARRLRTIYETNLRTAQAAGRWERAQRTKAARPYGRYVCLVDGAERAEHRAWHGTVLPLDHPWWSTHAPPNGWGCRCKMQQLSQRELDRLRGQGLEVHEREPHSEDTVWTNPRTGQRLIVPKGIDPGFDYNPGTEPRGFVPPPKKGTEIALTPVRDYRDEGRPSVKELRDAGELEEVVDRWHDVTGLKDAAERWRKMLGGKDSAEVTDPRGRQVTFSTRVLMHWFREAPGKGEAADATTRRSKAALNSAIGRASFAPRAKQTIEAPLEMWLQPSRRRDGSVVMRTMYIGAFDRQLGYAVVVEQTDSGHAFWTMVPTDELDERRRGYLLWARGAGA